MIAAINSRESGLSVKGLKVSMARAAVDVIDEVSFEVPAGRMLGIVGESGSGKTTAALALLGYSRRGLTIAHGTVTVAGDDVLELSPTRLSDVRGRDIAYVAQDPASALNPTLTVGRQLREPLLRHGAPGGVSLDERLAQMLKEVRLDGVADVLSAYPHQLSGGQQQRVMLAMAFACRPKVIVLDEPTTGLDVTTQRRVLDTVRDLCIAYGAAAVYVSHDLAVVGELVDAVAVMYAGRVIEYGPARDVLGHPRHPYTRLLISSMPGGEAQPAGAASGQAPRPGQRPVGCAFAARCRHVGEECRRTFPAVTPIGSGEHFVRCARIARIPEAATAPRFAGSGGASGSGAGRSLLTIDQVSAWYGNKRVLDDVSIAVAPGECLALVGESGSGKTTLARCIVGLHRGWEGTITYDGEPLVADLRARSERCIQDVQYIFQNPYTAMNPRKTIGQLVEQPLRECTNLDRRQRSERVVSALRDAALSEEFLTRFPDQLSGGERQRVAIARALALGPRLLVCDEITSALDVSVQASIIDLLRHLQQTQELTLVFITHNLPLVEMIAQQTAVMTEGQIIEAGPTLRVLREPRADYTARLLADAPKMLDPDAGTRPVSVPVVGGRPQSEPGGAIRG